MILKSKEVYMNCEKKLNEASNLLTKVVEMLTVNNYEALELLANNPVNVNELLDNICEYLNDDEGVSMDDFERTDRQFELAWKGYLDYLKEWADNHKQINNYGMSPACFDEWLDNEA